MLLSLAASALLAPSATFDDAVVVWHFADLSDSSGRGSSLRMSGAVTPGNSLPEPDAAASRARGGDGSAARLDGGRLDAGQGQGGCLVLAGAEMSLCVRLRLDAGVEDTPILSMHGGHEALLYNLFVTDLGRGPAIGFELGTDFDARPLQLSVPLDLVDPTAWHDVIVRFSGARLELWVDGVLVDEEWPLGGLRAGSGIPCLIGAESTGRGVKAGFSGWIDHAALWDCALTDEEILALSGGREEVARREGEILGPHRESMLYWRPRGHSASVGDCMPFSHDGRFHVFYLFDRRHHGSKWGLGAHQWAHVSSTDLRHWERHPMAIAIEEQWEASICTGSVIHDGDAYHAFYATRTPDGAQHLGHAVSEDGISFRKLEPNPFLSAPEGYDPMHLRDPLVFRGEDGLYRLLVTARLTDGRDGCIGQLLSPDLLAWDLADPLLVPGRVTDCPDCFEWGGMWYLLAEFVYWMAPSPQGPWTSPQPDRLDVLYVPKTAPFGPDRRIYVSWLPDGGWGGDMVFRELVRLPDGRLGTRFVPEMMPSEEALRPIDGRLPEAEQGVHLTARLEPAPDGAVTAIRFLGNVPGEPVLSLRLDSGSRSVGISEGGEVLAQIDLVEGLDRATDVTVVLCRDIIDVCIGGTRTLITRHRLGPRSAIEVEAGNRVAAVDWMAAPLSVDG